MNVCSASGDASYKGESASGDASYTEGEIFYFENFIIFW